MLKPKPIRNKATVSIINRAVPLKIYFLSRTNTVFIICKHLKLFENTENHLALAVELILME